MRTSILVVPCFNERARLRRAEILTLLDAPRIGVLLVDDGSTDGTPELISALARERSEGIEALLLPRNVGKGEATRAGLRAAIDGGATHVGYGDADFAAPARELRRLEELVVEGPHAVILGSRIARMGAHIERSDLRHVLGRVFATVAALALAEQVYDTQCGAKWFAVSPELRRSLSTPFSSRWTFDLELLLRLLGRIEGGPAEPLPASAIYEEPLRQWIDRGGSKLRPASAAGALLAALDLLRRSRRGPDSR